MKFLGLLTMTLLFQACSSSSLINGIGRYDEDLGISNEDFKPKTKVPYHADEDLYFLDIEEESVADWDEGPVLLQESISRVPRARLEKIKDLKSPISQAAKLCYQGKYGRGFELLDSVHQQYHEHPSYWNQIGTCFLLNREIRKAILYYNRSKDVNNKYAPPVNNLGVIYLQKKEYQKALKAFEKAAELNSYSLTPIFNMAQLYLEFGLINKAEKYFEVLNRKNKTDVDVLNGLATTYLYQNKVNLALNYFKQIPLKKLNDAHISLNYTVALHLNGEKAQAKKLFSGIKWSKELANYYQRVKNFIK